MDTRCYIHNIRRRNVNLKRQNESFRNHKFTTDLVFSYGSGGNDNDWCDPDCNLTRNIASEFKK